MRQSSFTCLTIRLILLLYVVSIITATATTRESVLILNPCGLLLGGFSYVENEQLVNSNMTLTPRLIYLRDNYS
jgi:hypothetical protein